MVSDADKIKHRAESGRKCLIVTEKAANGLVIVRCKTCDRPLGFKR